MQISLLCMFASKTQHDGDIFVESQAAVNMPVSLLLLNKQWPWYESFLIKHTRPTGRMEQEEVCKHLHTSKQAAMLVPFCQSRRENQIAFMRYDHKVE